jgi:hypothetical protein
LFWRELEEGTGGGCSGGNWRRQKADGNSLDTKTEGNGTETVVRERE